MAMKTTNEFIDDPIGKSVQVATQPMRDGLEIIDGLSEGQLKEKAICRLGIDVVSGMCLSELLDWYLNGEI
tara:strand:+ start:572 stop:784 length:213 start_codon:yes stop_codon:yes gene_type:complete